MRSNLIKTAFGYYQVSPKPSAADLEKYYAEKYWQGGNKTASQKYTDLEKKYFNHKSSIYLHVYKSLARDASQHSYLDIGCGEGWDLSAASSKFKSVRGLDYSSHGIKTHNPALFPFFKSGDIYRSLDDEIKLGNRYDFIVLKNVLEHVLDPESLMDTIKELLAPNGIASIQVPNDFSYLQEYLLHNSLVANPYWVVLPDHLNYFNKDALDKFFEGLDFKILKRIADFPIELDLLSSCSNYVSNNEVGKQAHKKRVVFEDLISKSSLEEVSNFYWSLAELGLGRCLNYFIQKL